MTKQHRESSLKRERKMTTQHLHHSTVAAQSLILNSFNMFPPRSKCAHRRHLTVEKRAHSVEVVMQLSSLCETGLQVRCSVRCGVDDASGQLLDGASDAPQLRFVPSVHLIDRGPNVKGSYDLPWISCEVGAGFIE